MPPWPLCEILLNLESEFPSWQLNPSDFDQEMLLALCPHRAVDPHFDFDSRNLYV